MSYETRIHRGTPAHILVSDACRDVLTFSHIVKYCQRIVVMAFLCFVSFVSSQIYCIRVQIRVYNTYRDFIMRGYAWLARLIVYCR